MSSIIRHISCTLLLFIIGISGPLLGQIDKAMTYNIRYDNPSDGINQWSNRKAAVVDLIQYYAPEVLGIQEGLHHQVTYLEDHLPNYSRIGVGRDDGKTKGEYTAIYYNNKALTLISGSTFWLSETDDRVSVGWDASMERICTYGLFESTSRKQRILVFNAHYDHIGPVARANSSKLILKKIKEINDRDYPVILMGDFNAEPNDEPVQVILDTLDDAAQLTQHKIYGPVGTFTAFEPNAIPNKRIDYIFSKGLAIKTYRHIDDMRKDGNYVSDHLPVLVHMEKR